ncbi:MAG: NAD-dependent DNA ligase LigA [Holosporales bacterium]|jgi:DNA ligase (NAD+)|nr:NAD-dependent DNA ligase LigA [Holosporales bacterium]
MMDRDKAAEELDRLTKEIAFHDDLYYNQAQPVISDAEYDQLRIALSDIEASFPDLIRADSPSHMVGAKPLEKFDKVVHQVPMLSLDNAFSEDDVRSFFEKANRFLNVPKEQEMAVFAEPKIDGLSASITYQYGVFECAATRGNGITGEDVTQNVKVIDSIPVLLPEELSEFPRIDVRGEVYMTKAAFKKVNAERESSGEMLFSTPRNAAAGSLRQLDTNVTKKRGLQFFAYEMVCDSPSFHERFPTQKSIFDFLEQCRFRIAKDAALCNSFLELLSFCQVMAEKRGALDYDIDGIVYKINDRAIQRRLGAVGRSPRHSIAYKFPAEQVKTVLRDIVVQVGRMGTLTPVAILDDVKIGGVTVNRATLHNIDEIEKKDICIGDTVILQRAGDVIPQVVGVDVTQRPSGSVSYIFPTKCPSCGGDAVRSDERVAIRCLAGFSCEAQAIERFRHFVSRDAFNIDGLGDCNIEFLYKTGRVKNFADIFTLKERNELAGRTLGLSFTRQPELGDNYRDYNSLTPLEDEPGWKSVSVKKLFDAIDSRRRIELGRFIYALGILLVGKQTAALLASYYKSFEAFRCADLQQLSNIDGIGKKTAQEIVDFLHNEEMRKVVDDLLRQVEVTAPEEINKHLLFSGQIIVFTGKLEQLSRKEAKSFAEKLGAQIGSTVTKNTNTVVAGKDAGKKLELAEQLGIRIVTEGEWIAEMKNAGRMVSA